MTHHNRANRLPRVVREKPLQTSKFLGILLVLVLGIAGFFRVIDTTALIDDPLLGDGQFLALVLIPLLSFGLILLVFIETLATGYRVLRSENPITAQVTDRLGYVLIRGAEAAIAVIGVLVMLTALPPLFADSTPGPAGVGIMLLLMAVGLGILFASFLRAATELFIYGGT